MAQNQNPSHHVCFVFLPRFCLAKHDFFQTKAAFWSLEHNFQTHFDTLTLRIRIKQISKTKKTHTNRNYELLHGVNT